MRSMVPAIALIAALPPAAQAQIDIRLSPQPSARGMVGPLSLSAILGPDGIDLRVDDRSVGVISTSRRTSIPGRRTSTSGTSTSRTSTSGTTSRASAAAVLATADRYVGTRYVWGGTTPNGFDCSGFVQYVFRRHGVQLPRTSRQQAGIGQAVVTALESPRAGDLMLFASNGSRIDHVAIYVGRNRIIHSSASGGGVAYDDLTSQRGRWFANHHVASRRVLADGRSLVGELDAALRALSALDPPDRAPRR
ncbi:MAG: C40 family peptidase [Longimicrobiales bacterium]